MNNIKDIVVFLGLKVFNLGHSYIFPAGELRQDFRRETPIETNRG